MGRPRKTNKFLPKYVTVINGSYWYRPTHGEHVRICKAGDEATLYRWMADKMEPIANDKLTTLAVCFDRYEREVLPGLAPRTQKDYRRALRVLR